MHNFFVKIRGEIFDDRLSDQKRINKVFSTCYAILRNLS